MTRGVDLKKVKTYKKIIIIGIIFILIPIFIVSIIDFIFINRNKKNSLEQQIVFEANRQIIYLNQVSSDIQTLQYICKKSKLYSDYYQNDVVNIKQMMDDMSEKLLSFSNFDDIYYYNLYDDKIYSSNGYYREDYFFSQKYRVKNLPDLVGTGENEFTYTRAKLIETGDYTTLVYVPLSYSVDNKKFNDRYIIVSINDSSIMNRIGIFSEHNEGKWIISSDDIILLTNSLETNEKLNEKKYYMSDVDLSDCFTYGLTVKNSNIKLLWILSDKIVKINTLKIAIYQGALLFIILSISVLVLFIIVKKIYRPIKDLVNTVSVYNGNECIQDDLNFLLFSIKDMIAENNDMENSNNCIKNETLLYQLLIQTVQKNDKIYNHLLDQGLDLDKKYFIIIILEDVLDNQQIYEFFVNGLSDTIENTYVDTLYTAGNRHICFISTDLEPEEVNHCIYPIIHGNEHVLIGKWVDDVSKIRQSFIELTIESGVEKNKVDSVLEINESEKTDITNKNYKKKNINNILLYIEENYCDPNFSLKCMSINFKTTSSNISHFFKNNTGQSISTYIELKKLAKAKQFLETQEYKINEIAHLVGYSNVSSFIELFKKYEGMTPSCYIERKIK